MIEQYFRDNYNTLVIRIQARHMQKADAEDVVQESFVRALKYEASLVPRLTNFEKGIDSAELVGPWFSAIMNNAFKDYRHANYTGDYSFCEEIAEELDEAERQWLDRDLLVKIQEEVSLLPKGQASIVQLVLLSGYKYKEAAQILDEKVENIRKVLYRFKQTMREKYGD